MIDYCPKNSTLSGIGFSNINRCFLDTITGWFSLALLFLCMSHHLKGSDFLTNIFFIIHGLEKVLQRLVRFLLNFK